jgi:FecR protein
MKFAKSTFLKSFFIAFAIGEVAFVVSIQSQTPTPTPEGRVTQIFHDVKLLPAQAEARAAVVDDKVDEDTGLRTGDDSRSELTFADLTITRLGANTVFSFNKAGRSVRLDNGSILLYVRKNSGGAEISTKAVSVGITGTTLIFESQPLSHDRLIVLEGDARFSLNNYPNQSTVVRAGQLLNVPAGAKKLPKPGRVNLKRIVDTHPLIKNFPPLPSLDLILAANQNPKAPAPGPPPAAPTAGQGAISNPPGYVPNPSGSSPLRWCCIDGQVVQSTEAECRARGGQAFRSEEEARAHCGESGGETWWCCIDGKVVRISEAQARVRGNQCYRSREEAAKACEARGKCWCCIDTANGMNVVQMTKDECQNGGGQCYGSRREALRNCRGKGPTPTPTPHQRPTARPTPRPTIKPTPKRPVSTGTPTTIRKYPVRKKSTPTPTPVQIR